MGYKILLPQDIHHCGKEYLSSKGYEIKHGTGLTREEMMSDAIDCHAILARTARIPREVMVAGKKIKVIARHGVGVDNIDCKAAGELGICVTNAPESNTNSVAEHAMALITGISKNIIVQDDAVRQNRFENRNQLLSWDLEGKTLSIIGLGRIGKIVAKKGIYGFGMKVIGYDPYIKREQVPEDIELVTDWEEIFMRSDFVSMHLPCTEETKGIIGQKEFGLMKNTAYFINVSRGEVVKEGELFEALKNKTISGAAIDVFETEPPEENNPLFTLNNIILSPHNAALTHEAMERMALHAAMGIDDVLSGRKPKWPVVCPENIRL